MVVVAYGKFGGIELGYGSDLDLVFLHDSAGEIQRTTGPQAVENSVFFLRLVQRLVHLLTVHSAAGRLYEVDTRLRPSGKGGLLVQSIEGFGEYQRTEAWTWEHQALLRARAVAGPPALRARFEALRREFCGARSAATRCARTCAACANACAPSCRGRGPDEFDLKHDAGGITDIEFLAQYWTLLWAERHPELVTYSDNIRQLESLASIDLVPQSTVDVLTHAYRAYRQRIHHLSLEGASNVVPAAEFAAMRGSVSAIWHATMEVLTPIIQGKRCAMHRRSSHGRTPRPDLARRTHRQDHDPRDQVAAHDGRGEARNVRTELGLLNGDVAASAYSPTDISAGVAGLRDVNAQLWDIEDRIRDKERDGGSTRCSSSLRARSTSRTTSARRSSAASTRGSARRWSRRRATRTTSGSLAAAAGSLLQRVLRGAVGAFRPAGLLDRQEDARVRVPQLHARHRAAKRQVVLRHLVEVLGIRLDELVAAFGRHGAVSR